MPKQSSISTIFSVWNSMVGTGLVTIPWAYQQSGLLLGIGILFLINIFIIAITFI